jgi:hypothetical protein
MLRRLCAAFSIFTLSSLSLAAEDEPPPEAPPPEPPTTAAPPPPAAAPPTEAAPAPPRVSPAAPPPGYPTPYWGTPAPAPEAPPQADTPSEPEEPEEPEGIVIPRWQIAAGVRTAFIANEGFDPFSDDDRFFQVSLGGGRTVYSQGFLSIAAIGFYDTATSSSNVRGESTELEVHRISLGPELRAHVLPMLYAFVRPSPAAIRSIARLDESTTNTTLYARAWTFGFDATAGVAFRAISFGKQESSPRLWLIGEGGYGWASSSDLRLAPDPDDDSAPERVAEVNLGTLAVRGPMFRVLVAATF